MVASAGREQSDCWFMCLIASALLYVVSIPTRVFG